jgi:hypothetical protein
MYTLRPKYALLCTASHGAQGRLMTAEIASVWLDPVQDSHLCSRLTPVAPTLCLCHTEVRPNMAVVEYYSDRLFLISSVEENECDRLTFV